jgi:hypothetical protein
VLDVHDALKGRSLTSVADCSSEEAENRLHAQKGLMALQSR